MTTWNKSGKQSRQRYPDEYKIKALKLVERVGTTAAAAELGTRTSQIYPWRIKHRHAETMSDAEIRLLNENARLMHELAEQRDQLALLKKTSAYFARNQK